MGDPVGDLLLAVYRWALSETASDNLVSEVSTSEQNIAMTEVPQLA